MTKTRRARHLKLLAAVAVVLVALSGFSPARSSGGKGGGSKSRSSGHSGGGGCSSKKSSSHSNSDSHSGYRSGARYHSTTGSDSSSSSSGGSGRSRASGRGNVVECAAETQDKPHARVRVRNTGGSSGSFTVRVNFNDSEGMLVTSGSTFVTVPANGTKTVKVPMAQAQRVDEVDDCELVSVS